MLVIQNGFVTQLDSTNTHGVLPAYVVSTNNVLCDAPCKKLCNEVKMVNKNILTNTFNLCDAPCNEGTITTMHSEEIPYPNCPNCKIRIEYLERITPPCEGYSSHGYNDIMLQNVEMVDFNACGNCTISTNNILAFANQWLIMNGFSQTKFHTTPCETNYRSFMASCWKDQIVQIWRNSDGTSSTSTYEVGEINIPRGPIILPYGISKTEEKIFRLVEPCESQFCCWQEYEICVDPITKQVSSSRISFSHLPPEQPICPNPLDSTQCNYYCFPEHIVE
jgi:hypothetical protein